MKTKVSLIIVILILFANTSFSQWGFISTLGAGGGVQFSYLSPSLDDINKEFKKVGLPELNNSILGFGGGGGVSFGRIRVGGYGWSGKTSATSNRNYNSENYESKIKLDYGGGFGMVGLELYQTKKFVLNFDLGIGGGGLDFFIIDKKSNFDTWDESLYPLTSSGNYSRKISYSFFALQPSIVIEYIYGNFFKMFFATDYNFILNGNWDRDDEFYLVNVPKMNFNGFSIRLGFYLGIFL